MAIEAFEIKMSRGGTAAVETACQFFMRNDPVHRSLEKITSRLEEAAIPYAVVGGMALVKHGYDRTTADVDILVTPEGLAEAHNRLEGLGYLTPFTGSKQLRDTETGVRIEFLVTGGFPGDGKPKPVSFPDPVLCSVAIDGVRYINLKSLVELKLASGMSGIGRLKDLADIQELIRAAKLPRSLVEQLNPYVREKYNELWQSVQTPDPINDEPQP